MKRVKFVDLKRHFIICRLVCSTVDQLPYQQVGMQDSHGKRSYVTLLTQLYYAYCAKCRVRSGKSTRRILLDF